MTVFELLRSNPNYRRLWMGQVVSETLVTGTGNRLDQIVLDIVRTWRFQPATVNGKPVKQGFTITFDVNPGLYSFSYRFLPITVASHIASLK